MNFSKISIKVKIFVGFTSVLFVALVLGGIGYFSLGKVVNDAEINSLALLTGGKLLEARHHENEYLALGEDQAHANLMGSLDEMGKVLPLLKDRAGSDNASNIESLGGAREKYLQASAEMKRITQEKKLLLKKLQAEAAEMTGIADQASRKAAADTRDNILKSNEKAFTEYATKEVQNVVALGCDVLKYYHDAKLDQKDALNVLRNMHFEGDNYYFVVQENLTLVAHGSNRKLEGMDFGVIKDKKTGKAFMQELVKAAMDKGEAIVSYYWNKPGMGEEVFPKITAAKYFAPWGLIVAAGAYVDDIQQKANETSALLEDGIKDLNASHSINSLMLQARLNALYYFKYGTNADLVSERLNELKSLNVASSELKAAADSYAQDFKTWVKDTEMLETQMQDLSKTVQQGMAASKSINQSADEDFRKSVASGKTTILIFILAGIAIGLTLAWRLMLSIARPIQKAIDGLKDASDQVASASQQVSSSSQHLSEGASGQAAAIEETSSSIEEMASMTKANADNANQANAIVKETQNDMNQANTAMSELTSSMSEISRASSETQKIVKTIDEIAFQTNLLALNAAVEAARAGEAGAGFAVVADEVRNLAMRAADAAKNTANLIQETVLKINRGSNLVEATNEAFRKAVSGASKVGALVSEISAASDEQARGIDQVSKAITEMDKITQQNAATAEESASASEEMNAQAEQTKQIVSELVVLVDGAGNGQHNGERLMVEQRPRNVAKSAKSGRRPHSALSNREISPSQVIPLDDKDFTDF